MSSKIKDIKYLESLVTGIKEVTGCRILTDADGGITDVYVTAESDRHPRLISRDVQTLLLVREGLEVDRRKIMVAATKTEPELPAPAEEVPAVDREEVGEEELVVEDREFRPERVLYDRITVTHEAGRVLAAVTLSREERQVVGEARSADTDDGHLSAVVEATLAALLQLFRPRMEFASPQFKIESFGREEIMVVYLSAVEGRDIQTYTGSAVIRQDASQAAVLATLSALNRVAELWQERDGLDFEIL